MNKEITPIFVMGAPRSGTTFLASSIASHPNIVALLEMHYIFRLMEEELIFGEISLARKTELLQNDFHFCSLNLFTTREELKSFLETKNTKEIILSIISLYNEKYHQKDYDFWVEHSPHSHQYIEVIKEYFPNALFVQSIRDPRAVIASTFKELWGFKDVVTGAKTWNNNVMSILKKAAGYNIHTVKYEDLVEDVDGCLKTLCDQIDIAYSKEMLNNNGILVPEYFDKKVAFTGAKADKTRKEKWKTELSKKQIGHIQAINHKLMEKFGYIVDDNYSNEIKGFEKYVYMLIGRLKHLYTKRIFKKEVENQFCHMN